MKTGGARIIGITDTHFSGSRHLPFTAGFFNRPQNMYALGKLDKMD
jgi:hypothetical protein